MSLRILMITPGASLAYYSYQLCRALHEAELSVNMLTMNNYEMCDFPHSFSFYPLIHDYSPFMGMPKRVSTLRSLYLRLAASARTIQNYILILLLVILKRPTICHFQWNISRCDSLIFRMLKAMGIRVVHTVHNVQPHESESSVDPDMDYWAMYRCANALIAHTVDSKKNLVQIGKVEPKRVSVIPHGSYPIYFEEPLQSRWMPAPLPSLDGKQVILFFGLIRPYKGLEVLIKAFRMIRFRMPDCMLVVVGRVLGSTAYQSLIQQITTDKGIIAHLENVPLEQVPSYFLAADVVVLPYKAICQSGVLFTAYSFGRPVVASRVGGLTEAIDDGNSGILVPPGDESSLSKALIRILTDDLQRKKMGIYAENLARTRYSWADIAQQTSDLYRRLSKK